MGWWVRDAGLVYGILRSAGQIRLMPWNLLRPGAGQPLAGDQCLQCLLAYLRRYSTRHPKIQP